MLQRQAAPPGAAHRGCSGCLVPFRAPARRAGPRPRPSAATKQQQEPAAADLPPRVRLPGIDGEIALSPEPTGPGFIPGDLAATAPWVRPGERTFTPPSIRDSGTLRPGPEWFPAWMKYRRREDNYVFWQDKFLRCSLEIPDAEKRWTLFSSLWFLVMEFKYNAVPPALRYLWWGVWRAIMQRVYEAHKAVVLWQSKLDAALAERAVQQRAASGATAGSSSGEAGSSESSSSSGGGGSGGSGAAAEAPGFSRAMALRRLHWKNSLLGEILYLINVAKTGRVHMLPPPKRPLQRPTFFFVF